MNIFLDEILDILWIGHNKKRVQFRTNEDKLRLLLRTMSHDSPILEYGKGFRALAFATGYYKLHVQ